MRRAEVPWIRPSARSALLLLLVLLVAGCEFVYPAPPAGAPVPNLVFTLSEPEPVAGEFTVTVTEQNLSPTEVWFRLDTTNGAPHSVDSEPPFTLTLNTRELAAGPHTIWAGAADGTYVVRKKLDLAFNIRPNIVVVQLDDLDQVGMPYWEAMPQTQALLADAGLTFENAFVTDPLCCPSRASSLTGRYPHNSGVYDNSAPDGGYAAFAAGSEGDTIATRLQVEGYTTAYIGKYLNGYNPLLHGVRPGWTEWFGVDQGVWWNGYGYNANHNGVIAPYGWQPEDYQTDVLSGQTNTFVSAAESDDGRPFFVYLNPLAPHANMGPAQRHQPNPFGGALLPTRPNFEEADLSDKPTWLREGFPLMDEAALLAEAWRYQEAIGSLLAVDDMIASLVDTLAENGELDRTIIVFTSDNGMNLGAHRLGHKMAPYEESIRVPFVMRGPGVPVGSDDHFVTNIDLAPTVLHLAGAGDQPELDGRSIVPLLLAEEVTWRNDFLIELRATNPSAPSFDTLQDVRDAIAANGSLGYVPTYRAVRDEQWLYVEWYGGTAHEYELYELSTDPYQLTNLLSTPEGVAEHAALTATLQSRLEELGACSGPLCRT